MEPKAAFARCDECPLANRPVVPGDGPVAASRVIVGEAPGKSEVLQGKPFVGKAGQRLDAELFDAGVDRRRIYITNAVLCHPEGNESPPPSAAVAACHDRLVAEIKRYPRTEVLALGKTAGKVLSGDSRPIQELRLLRPTPSPYLGERTELRVTYHPSALTRDKEWPTRFAEDLKWLGQTSAVSSSERLGSSRYVANTVLFTAVAICGWLWIRDKRRSR
jgi:uracil-DNA glycosylase family 4